MKTATTYGLCALTLAVIGVGTHWGLANRQQEARLAASHVAEVEALLARVPASKSHAGAPAAATPNSAGAVAPTSIGVAVEAAAKQGGLDPGSVREVKPANPAGSGEGWLTIYRIRLSKVRPERLVKFIYVLESQDRLRTTELDLERQSVQAPDWDASLLVVRAL